MDARTMGVTISVQVVSKIPGLWVKRTQIQSSQMIGKRVRDKFWYRARLSYVAGNDRYLT